jgi:hypothetical protein
MPLLVELFVEAKALLAVGAIGDDSNWIWDGAGGRLILEKIGQF